MKATDRKLAYSGVIVLAVIAAEVAWFLFVGPANRNPYYATECESNCDIPWWAAPEFWTAAFTAALTGSTILLWWVTRNTWIHAQESSERQLRAYVSLNPTSISNFRIGQCIYTEARMFNHGETPAAEIGFKFDYAIFPNPLPGGFRFPVPARQLTIENSIFPKGEVVLSALGDTPVTVEEIDSVYSDTRRLHWWGELSYRDVFGQKRITRLSANVGGAAFQAANWAHFIGEPDKAPRWLWGYGIGHNDAT
jgi:hypothetical protein